MREVAIKKLGVQEMFYVWESAYQKNPGGELQRILELVAAKAEKLAIAAVRH